MFTPLLLVPETIQVMQLISLKVVFPLESLSGVCDKLHTVVANSIRDDHHKTSLSSSPLTNTANCSPGSQVLGEVTLS